MVSGTYRNLDRQMHESVIDLGNEGLGLPRHGRMYGMGSKSCTIDGIEGISRGTSDDIGRINIFYIGFDTFLLEVGNDTFLQENTDILIFDIAEASVSPVEGTKS